MPLKSTKSPTKQKKNRKRPVDGSEYQHISSPPMKKGSAAVKHCSIDEAFETRQNKKGELLLVPESLASYVRDNIWAILESVGFRYNHSGFGHPDIVKKNHNLSLEDFGHEDGLRKYLSRHGIPGFKELKDEEDAETVKKWVAFAYVPLKESEFDDVLAGLPLPSDEQALEWLMKLGFQVEDRTGNIFRPTSDGVDYFHSIEETRCFVRSADDSILLTTPRDDTANTPRKRSRRSKAAYFPLDQEQILALRLWAAVSPSPLPKFHEEGEPSDDEKELPADARTDNSGTCIIL